MMNGRENIYTNISVASILPPSMLEDYADFMVANRHLLYSSEKKSEAFKTRFSNSSLLTDIVHRLTLSGGEQYFNLIRFPSKTIALREAVDITFLPFDFKQMEEILPHLSSLLQAVPDLQDKMLLNITDITKANGEFSDITQFQYRITRDFLSRSYYSSGGNAWISPLLVRYVAKVYSMTIGGQMARFFGLSPFIQSFIQTVFASFFVGKMTAPHIAPAFLKVHGRAMRIAESTDLQQILSFIGEKLGHDVPQSLEEVCQVIDAFDHDQLKTTGGSRIDRPVLNMKFSNMFPEKHVSVIALEYPPFFLFLIILALSGIRIGLSINMKAMNLVSEGQEVMDQLVKSSLFFNGL